MKNMASDSQSGHLLRNLVLFGRLLRGLGLDVNPGRMIDLVDSLEFINIGNKSDFYHAACSLLVHHQEDIALFDEAFEIFWRKPADGWTTLDLRALGEKRRFRGPTYGPPPLEQPPKKDKDKNEENQSAGDPPHLKLTLTYSSNEVLRHKDFAELTGEEMEAIKKLISTFIWKLGHRQTRRMQPGRDRLLDFRRTLRRNLRYGGELIDISRRRPISKPRPLVIIADISGSMERYTRLILHFIYSLGAAAGTTLEAFLFSTRLTRVSHHLKGRDIDSVLGTIARTVPDWSGGTRIGEALKQFNFQWGKRVLGRRAAVVIISDGWDRGDSELLRDEMARLHRTCYHLIWLNPLSGHKDYEPLTKGMRTALPFLDAFLPVHNLASLEQLAGYLERLGGLGSYGGSRFRGL